MSAAGSSSAANSGRRLPLIKCPDCRWKVKMYVSNTEKHPRWRFYKCTMDKVTCNFWHWEKQYEEYLVVHGHLDVGPQEVVEGYDDEHEVGDGQEVVAEQEVVTMLKKKKKKEEKDEIMLVMMALLQLGSDVVKLLKCDVVLLFLMLVVGLVAIFRF